MADILDPHKALDNNQNIDISKLTFYASLKVTKRNRLSGVNQGSVVVNLLGSNLKTGLFTTDWTNNAENFGIKSINVKLTPSYVPQVDIVYEDVRGQSLFNDNIISPYRVLFDMPPPIFDLTLKGYYGQPVTYRLHLIKGNANLTNNGSYELKQTYVGMTYAPLSDLLIDYCYVAPYLDGNNPNKAGNQVSTTLELKSLSSRLVSIVKTITSKDKILITNNTDLINRLKIRQPSYITYLTNLINNISGQNTGYYKEIKLTNTGNILNISYSNLDKVGDIYNTLKDTIQTESDFIKSVGITDITIPLLPDFKDIKIIKGNNYNSVKNLNLKNIDSKINGAILNLNTVVNNKITFAQAQTKSIVQKFLPGGATLKSVLTIILADAYTFYTKLKKVVDNAQTNRANTNDTSNGDSSKYAFPEYFKTNTKVKSIPENNTWDEVKFVNNYIDTKVRPDVVSIENAIDSLGVQADINTIVRRGYVILRETTDSPSDAYINSFINGEVNNIFSVLENNPTQLGGFISTISKTNFSFTSITSTPFNTEINTNSTFIVGATNGVTYSGSSQFLIYTKDNFSENGGIPVDNSKSISSYGTDNYSVAINSFNDILNSSNTGSFDEKSVLCQYNVPLFKDKENDDYLNKKQTDNTVIFNSDFILNPIIPNANIDSSVSVTKWLDLICRRNVINPFDAPRFRQISAIYEVPFFVLAWWGWSCSPLNPNPPSTPDNNYKTLPDNIKTLLINQFTEYSDMYSRYFKNSDGSVIFNNSDGTFNNNSYYISSFFTQSIEIRYILMGDTTVFDSSKVSKQINFTTLPNPLINDVNFYFTSLRNALIKANISVNDTAKKQQNEVQSKVRTEDIKTQLYYTLKEFVDRWMLGDNGFNIGDLLNPANIDSNFLMVDRGFNNIGDQVILDLTPLYDVQTTADTSLYTLLMNLLSKNNFEFFALPSYVDFKDNGLLWSHANINKIFGPTNIVTNVKQTPKFICMYVGGTSAQLDINSNSDLSHQSDSDSISKIPDLSNINAFAIDFGTQNQSFFTNVELDQAEFKETNESIKMLDNIAKSQTGTDSVTNIKGNNLFNVYEQRSYTCTVHGLGNVMLQPTMYFDLRNIAMFKGAYLIVDVEHHIIPNNFKTTFRGVRIPKYPKPYVTDYSVIANLENGTGVGLTNPQISNTIQNGRGITNAEIVDINAALISNSLGSIQTTGLTNNEKALLDTIAYAEGTLGRGSNNGYDIINGNSTIVGWTPTYKQGFTYSAPASGRYQFLYTTWIPYGKGDGIVQGDPKNKPFNAKNQDLTALNIIKTKRLNQFSFSLNISAITKDNFINYIDALSPEWVSLPFYHSVPLAILKHNPNWNMGGGWESNQPVKHTLDELWIVYSLALKKYTKT